MVTDEEIRSWFKDHEAKYLELPTEILNWQNKNGTGYFRIRYILDRGTLSVSGDLGWAIYEWHTESSLAGLSRITDIDYFEQKCQASEAGRSFKEWSPEKAMDWLNDSEALDYGFSQEFVEEAAANVERQIDWIQHLESSDLDDQYDFYGIGEVIHPRCRAHLIGLKLAVQQLQEQGVLHAR